MKTTWTLLLCVALLPLAGCCCCGGAPTVDLDGDGIPDNIDDDVTLDDVIIEPGDGEGTVDGSDDGASDLDGGDGTESGTDADDADGGAADGLDTSDEGGEPSIDGAAGEDDTTGAP